jgi:hypothetical protein
MNCYFFLGFWRAFRVPPGWILTAVLVLEGGMFLVDIAIEVFLEERLVIRVEVLLMAGLLE